jgi:hypothetical protein
MDPASSAAPKGRITEVLLTSSWSRFIYKGQVTIWRFLFDCFILTMDLLCGRLNRIRQ